MAAITVEVVAQMAKVAAADLAIVLHVPPQNLGPIRKIVQMDLSSYIFFRIQQQCQHSHLPDLRLPQLLLHQLNHRH